MSSRRINTLVILIGLAALSYLIYEIGPRAMLDQLITIGPFFPLVLLVEACSNTASNGGWYYAFSPDHRPRFTDLLKISFASFSVAGQLPTGQAGEVAKWNLIRGRAKPSEAVSSLLIYNYLHVLVTSVCTAVGPVMALVAGVFEPNIVWITLAITVVMSIALAVGLKLLYIGLTGTVQRIGRWRWIPWTPSEMQLDKVRDIDSNLRGVLSRPGDLWRASFWLVIGRVFSVVEIYVILWAMGVPNSVVISTMVFSATAVVNYILMILPAREGFLEASTLGVFKMLGMNGGHGLSLELTRRLRKIVYQVIGIGLMVALSRSSKAES